MICEMCRPTNAIRAWECTQNKYYILVCTDKFLKLMYFFLYY